jgi:hypothetical protein
MADRLATGNTPRSNVLHATQGKSGVGSRPHSPTRTYTSSSRIPSPLFPSFQRELPTTTQQLVAQRPTTQAKDIVDYMREYASLGPEFHNDMTLVEYCGLRLRNHPRDPQRGGQQQQQDITWISFGK